MELCGELGIATNGIADYWQNNISAASIGKGKQALKKNVVDDILNEFELS